MTLKEKFTKVEFEKYVFKKDIDLRVEFEKIADDYAIEFAEWIIKNDTIENAEKWLGYSDKDMLNEFKKEKGL